MLTREILPWIASRCGFRSDRGSTGLGGSSQGGLVPLDFGLRHVQHFDKLAVLSPSVWWEHRSSAAGSSSAPREIWNRPRLW